MHKDCMDVCIEVGKSYRISSNRYSLKIRWWNLGYTQNPYPLTHNFSYCEIKNPTDWLDITNKLTNKRDKSGPPV